MQFIIVFFVYYDQTIRLLCHSLQEGIYEKFRISFYPPGLSVHRRFCERLYCPEYIGGDTRPVISGICIRDNRPGGIDHPCLP
jgi:hypothetical protein